ncbi:MAG: hypothetical protein ACI9DM_002716 [Cyclobacteriaceae bacterium]
MNLLRATQSASYHEDTMQEALANHLELQMQGYWPYVGSKVMREVSIPVIRRRSDVVFKVTNRKVFNIECKTNQIGNVLHQAKDHKKWANYSYICLAHDIYVPMAMFKHLYDEGIGLIYWHGMANIFIEALHARPSQIIDKSIREQVLEKI